ncbi:DUF605-domain-containing protein [Ascobolus immersus RN42]|uniref:DUF605-domain-containing protein n=1 Tax=Ascobolus immersus RN42 TaxID=1160509 RepID=A0A3N4IL43_ASCIM|nr:DUF605-domain-containing protein [Ascobolus immersus RN42]
MVQKPPLKLKLVAPYILRGIELENINPIIAYYCFYHAVEQIITHHLQEQDAECRKYTIELMENLEQRKAALGDETAITDKMAGEAYVENFADGVFRNAENALNARKATRKTAETFRSAALFLQLLKFFGDLDPEVQSKIKFAKFQATRILKALAAGEDPNLPEEKPKEEEDGDLPAFEDGQAWNPPPLEKLGLVGNYGQPASSEDVVRMDDRSSPAPLRPPQPYVEDAPDNSAVSPASMHYEPSRSESRPVSQHSQQPPAFVPSPPSPPVIDLATAFPTQSAIPSQPPSSFSLPSGITSAGAPSFHQHFSPPPSAPHDPSYNPYFQSPHSQNPPSYSSTPSQPEPSAPQDYYRQTPSAPSAPVFTPQPQSAQPSQAPPRFEQHQHTNNVYAAPTGRDNLIVPSDDTAEIIAKAQKHAKWAISALNYDDVETAVKELRGALKLLGAS